MDLIIDWIVRLYSALRLRALYFSTYKGLI